MVNSKHIFKRKNPFTSLDSKKTDKVRRKLKNFGGEKAEGRKAEGRRVRSKEQGTKSKE